MNINRMEAPAVKHVEMSTTGMDFCGACNHGTKIDLSTT